MCMHVQLVNLISKLDWEGRGGEGRGGEGRGGEGRGGEGRGGEGRGGKGRVGRGDRTAMLLVAIFNGGI